MSLLANDDDEVADGGGGGIILRVRAPRRIEYSKGLPGTGGSKLRSNLHA